MITKRIITISLLFLSIQFSSAQTWTEVFPGFTGENYIAVDIPSLLVGYISGYNGNIIKTTDGGNTWNQLNTGTDITFECIEFTGETRGFAAGSGDSIYSTTDGGISWKTDTLPGYKYGFSFPSANIGYVVGADGMAYKFESNNWSELSTGTTRVLHDVHFTSDNIGFVFGGFFDTECVIKKTIDGGLNWSSVTTPNNNAIYGVHFPTDSIGYAVGWNGNILKTTDTGDTWNELTSGVSEVLQKVFFINDSIGYVTGNSGTLLKTIDGGITWNQETISFSNDLYGIFFNSEGMGFAVGTDENILKNTGETVIFNLSDVIKIYPNPTHKIIKIEISDLNNLDYSVFSIRDINGKILTEEKMHTDIEEIDLSKYSNGIYFIQVRTLNEVLSAKIIKN